MFICIIRPNIAKIKMRREKNNTKRRPTYKPTKKVCNKTRHHSFFIQFKCVRLIYIRYTFTYYYIAQEKN